MMWPHESQKLISPPIDFFSTRIPSNNPYPTCANKIGVLIIVPHLKKKPRIFQHWIVPRNVFFFWSVKSGGECLIPLFQEWGLRVRFSELETRNGPNSDNNPSPTDEHPGPAIIPSHTFYSSRSFTKFDVILHKDDFCNADGSALPILIDPGKIRVKG
jgi:hypothetical protein